MPPLQNVGSTVWLSAATWNIGALTSVTSVLDRSTSSSRFTVFQAMLAWLSMTPLGRPVVPEVYMIMQVSPWWTGSSMASAAPSWYVVSGSFDGTSSRSTVALCGAAQISTDAPLSLRMYANSGGASRKLSGTKTPPSMPVAKSASRKPGWFGPR